MKQTISTTGIYRIPVSVKVGKLFSWANIAKVLNLIPLDICHCETKEDAKMYVKVLLIFFGFIIIVNLLENLPL